MAVFIHLTAQRETIDAPYTKWVQGCLLGPFGNVCLRYVSHISAYGVKLEKGIEVVSFDEEFVLPTVKTTYGDRLIKYAEKFYGDFNVIDETKAKSLNLESYWPFSYEVPLKYIVKEDENKTIRRAIQSHRAVRSKHSQTT